MYTTYGKVNSFLLSAIPEFRERYKEEKQKHGKHPKQYMCKWVLCRTWCDIRGGSILLGAAWATRRENLRPTPHARGTAK